MPPVRCGVMLRRVAGVVAVHSLRSPAALAVACCLLCAVGVRCARNSPGAARGLPRGRSFGLVAMLTGPRHGGGRRLPGMRQAGVATLPTMPGHATPERDRMPCAVPRPRWWGAVPCGGCR